MYYLKRNRRIIAKGICILILCLPFLSLISCGDPSAPCDEGTKIYLAGTEYNSELIAKYWINGKDFRLTDGTHQAEAFDIFVDGNDVYVAGYEENETKSVAMYWKNGVETALTDGTKTSGADDLFIINDDIYVLGGERDTTTGNLSIIYWKNGTAVPVTCPTKNSTGNKIFVDGNDVYIAGYQHRSDTEYSGKYWKNGVEVSVTDETNNSVLHSIAVPGNNVLVVGVEYHGTTGIAKYWENGTAVPLTDGTYQACANDIYISFPNVNSSNEGPALMIAPEFYIAGLEKDGKAVSKYFCNGVPTPLSDGTKTEYVYSIFVTQ